MRIFAPLFLAQPMLPAKDILHRPAKITWLMTHRNQKPMRIRWTIPVSAAAVLAILLLTLQGCVEATNPYPAFPPGPWRGVLLLKQIPVSSNPKGAPLPDKVNLKFEEISAGELPFNFDVQYVNPDSFFLVLHNGEEDIILSDIQFGKDPASGKDTFLIKFPIYQAYLRGVFAENLMEGEWIDKSKGDYRIPFQARHGRNHRFTPLQKTPATDISGKWEVQFETDTDHPYPAIGEFQQKKNYLSGTFLTPTGDFRFLEGTIQGNKIYLSAFDGAHAFLLEAKIQTDSTITGGFWSGYDYTCTWEGRRNPSATLPDPHAMTLLRPGITELSFRFPDTEGKEITLDDPAFDGKVKIIQIMGSWCPNCRDESEFLVNYLRKNPTKDVAVIALAFERIANKTQALEALRSYKKDMQIPYHLLYAGSSDKKEAAKALPMLNRVVAYPTMILVDKQNKVRKIHTGFAGPATSAFAAFQSDFQSNIDQLLAEK